MAEAPILLADDDEDLCAMLQEYLSQDGFDVASVHNGRDALSAAGRGDYALLVLDIMLPGMQGLEVLRELRRQQPRMPVIMLTARGDDTDRIVGLELGADDYLPKPCNPRELAARIRAVLRRSSEPPLEPASYKVGTLALVAASRTVHIDQQPLLLTATEFETLHLLLRNGASITTKEALSEQILKRPIQPFDRSIDMHISNLRKKLQAAGAGDLIVTHRGAGYSIDAGSVE